MKRKVCIITGTRAEWGLLSGVARELASRPDVELQIVATNMHLDPAYGMTVNPAPVISLTEIGRAHV